MVETSIGDVIHLTVRHVRYDNDVPHMLFGMERCSIEACGFFSCNC